MDDVDPAALHGLFEAGPVDDVDVAVPVVAVDDIAVCLQFGQLLRRAHPVALGPPATDLQSDERHVSRVEFRECRRDGVLACRRRPVQQDTLPHRNTVPKTWRTWSVSDIAVPSPSGAG